MYSKQNKLKDLHVVYVTEMPCVPKFRAWECIVLKLLFLVKATEMAYDKPPSVQASKHEQEHDAYCKVSGLKCVRFPPRAKCRGITMGGCVSKFEIVAEIL